jgi:hypothetical protein
MEKPFDIDVLISKVEKYLKPAWPQFEMFWKACRILDNAGFKPADIYSTGCAS